MDESITNILNECPDCAKFRGRLLDLCAGTGVDGRPSPTVTAVTRFREKHGIRCNVLPRQSVHGNSTGTASLGKVTDQPWDISQPSRGLGDTIAKGLDALGVRKVAEKAVAYVGEKLTGKKSGCGCKKRQNMLNRLVPYGG